MSDDNEQSQNDIIEDAILCTFESCDEQVVGKCHKCGLRYCLTHASEVDPQNYCILCLTHDEIDFKEEPLVDKDGVQHKGRHITDLKDAYKTTNKLIAELTDVELEIFIAQYTALLHDAEKTRDFRSITLSNAKYEKYERETFTLRKVGGTFRAGTSDSHKVERSRVRSGSGARQAKPKIDEATLIANLKALGLTPERLAKLVAEMTKVTK